MACRGRTTLNGSRSRRAPRNPQIPARVAALKLSDTTLRRRCQRSRASGGCRGVRSQFHLSELWVRTAGPVRQRQRRGQHPEPCGACRCGPSELVQALRGAEHRASLGGGRLPEWTPRGLISADRVGAHRHRAQERLAARLERTRLGEARRLDCQVRRSPGRAQQGFFRRPAMRSSESGAHTPKDRRPLPGRARKWGSLTQASSRGCIRSRPAPVRYRVGDIRSAADRTKRPPNKASA
jgi:hypothetical protein